jgi:hypothetical protein
MLMAHSAVLNKMLQQYELLRELNAEEGTPEARWRLDDLAYSLCIATGTNDVDAAVVAARHRLPGARPYDDSLLAG